MESENVQDLYWRIIRKQHHYYHRKLESLDLYPGQPQVLYQLHEDKGVVQSDLAHLVFVTPSTLATMLNRMEKRGFIRREPHNRDGRKKNVFLTPRGRESRCLFGEFIEETNRLFFMGIGGEEKKVMKSVFLKMLNNLDAMERIREEET